MIETFDLSKRFGRITAVDAVNLKVPRGQVVGFLGPNGAGKTTTIRMICGYLPPSAGSITLDGVNIADNPYDVRRRIGYLPESTPLYPEMRVREYLRFRARLYGIARSARKSAIDLALRRCGLDEVARRPVGQLSKGYRQRVGLAAALLHEPPVLILDEPTVGLDPRQIVEVRALIRELAGRHTILLSTHILPEVEITCDRIVMIARGRIRADGTVEQLRAKFQPGNRYVIETDDRTLAERLRGDEVVERVEESVLADSWMRLAVEGRQMNGATGDQPRQQQSPGRLSTRLWELCAKASGRVREFRSDAPTLEQIFIRICDDAAGQGSDQVT